MHKRDRYAHAGHLFRSALLVDKCLGNKKRVSLCGLVDLTSPHTSALTSCQVASVHKRCTSGAGPPNMDMLDITQVQMQCNQKSRSNAMQM
jgi:hypothetical protein